MLGFQHDPARDNSEEVFIIIYRNVSCLDDSVALLPTTGVTHVS
jgi:hypothetical protein